MPLVQSPPPAAAARAGRHLRDCTHWSAPVPLQTGARDSAIDSPGQLILAVSGCVGGELKWKSLRLLFEYFKECFSLLRVNARPCEPRVETDEILSPVEKCD